MPVFMHQCAVRKAVCVPWLNLSRAVFYFSDNRHGGAKKSTNLPASVDRFLCGLTCLGHVRRPQFSSAALAEKACLLPLLGEWAKHA